MPTREEYAEMLTADMHGYDAEMDYEAFGADDPIKRGGLSTLPIQLSIANLASLSVELFSQADVDAAALPTGIASPSLADYKKAVRYFLANPAMLQSINLSSSETSTGGAPVLQSLKVQPIRDTPFGLNCSNELQLQAVQTTHDFQANRSTMPLKVVIDGFTKLKLVTAQNNSGATITINAVFYFGARVENRKQLRGGAPLAIRPGGRGPAPIAQRRR